METSTFRLRALATKNWTRSEAESCSSAESSVVHEDGVDVNAARSAAAARLERSSEEAYCSCVSTFCL